jgi:hypothetical protein
VRTGALARFAFVSEMEGSQDMSFVADLNTLYGRTIQGCTVGVKPARTARSYPEAGFAPPLSQPYPPRKWVVRRRKQGESAISIRSRRSAGLQNDLLLVSVPHCLIKIAKHLIVFLPEGNQV